MAGGLSPPIVGLRRLREPGAGLWTKGRLRPRDADGDAVSAAVGAGDTNSCSVRSGL
jgi:phage head maturation protease